METKTPLCETEVTNIDQEYRLLIEQEHRIEWRRKLRDHLFEDALKGMAWAFAGTYIID